MGLNRVSVKIAGASGQGINTIGELLAHAIKKSGYKLFGYREYPSLIKGGHGSYQLDFSDTEINSSSSHCDILVSLGRVALHKYLRDLNKDGILVHPLLGLKFDETEKEFIKTNEIKILYIDAFKMAEELAGKIIYANTILTALTWKILGLQSEVIEKEISDTFGKKPEILQMNLKALEMGLNLDLGEIKPLEITFKADESWKESMIVAGNAAITLGSISAGVKVYYGYPMTPSSSILTFHANFAKEMGLVVKQAEDEITAVQMAAGSMFMGTRALVATSGGGYDLMTETISMVGMTETPLVCILGQRPGPATGMPTWTGQGDLNLAVYGSHGEFPRCVLAASDGDSAYRLVHEAFNIAEKYQVPVILLTDKQIAEGLYNINELSKTPSIDRGLVDSTGMSSLDKNSRFKITENGVSQRWLPGTSDITYVANSDEHLEDGSVTEDADPSQAMIEKRMKKLVTLSTSLPLPTLYGNEGADTTLVGWGSTKATVLDAMKEFEKQGSGKTINYLHFEYIYPLNWSSVSEMMKKFKRLILLEGNSLGQLGNLIEQNADIKLAERFLKYNGRPFFVEDILDYINSHV